MRDKHRRELGPRDSSRERQLGADSKRRRLAAVAGSGLIALMAVGVWSLGCRPQNEPSVSRDETERRGDQMPDNQMEAALEPGQTSEHRLPGGESHGYRLALGEGDFVAVAVEQKGLDVVARLFAPGGEMLTEVDSPIGSHGVERVTGIAATGGDYRVEVEAFPGGEESGTYAISIEALRPATDEDRTRVAAEWAFARGEGLRRAKRPGDALPEYQQALEGWRALGDRGGEAAALYRIGWMHHDLDQYQQAEEHYRKALDIYRELGERKDEATVSNRLGRVLLVLGRLEEAEEKHRHALELFTELGGREEQASAENNLGNVYKWTGRTEEALEAYERALAIWEETGSRYRVTAQFNIGDVYLAKDDTEVALASFERALEGAREIGLPDEEAACLFKAGEALARLGRAEDARVHLEDALEIRRDLDDRRNQAMVLTSLGTLRLETDDLTGAKKDLEEALQLFVEVKDPVGQALAHHKLGRYYFAAGDADAARHEHELALPLFVDAGDRQSAASARYGIARALYATQDYEGARGVLEEVLDSAESLRADTASLELRSSYIASRRHYWDLYVSSLMRLHDQAPSSHFDLLALQATERSRARGLLDLLAEAGVQIRDGAPPELLEREQRIGTELDALARDRLRAPDESTPNTFRSNLSNREAELLLELDRTRAQIRSQSSRFEELTDPDPLNLAQIKVSLLDADTLMLVYFLDEERSFLWDVSRKQIGSHVLPARGEIEEAASDYYELLQRRSSRATEHRRQVGERLSQMLLGPVAERLGTKRLVVVADGTLHYLPFTTLPTPRAVAETDDELLIDHHEIVHLPSASVLASLRSAQERRPRARKTIAVIADPVFDPEDPRIAQGSGDTNRPTVPSDANDALDRALRDTGSGGLHRLPHSAKEAEAILALVPEKSSFRAQGFEASYSLLEGNELADYRILHFATHGLIDRKHPELSGLALSLFDQNGAPTRGFLRLHDIYNLRIGAELVVLSACETGLGQELEGEGLVGLTRGFLYAGAPRVIHSLWKVGDASAAELMKRFYTQLLQKDPEDNLAPSAALRAAQLSMRQDQDWSEPFQWAGFVFQGDWGAADYPLGEDIEGVDAGGVSAGGGTKAGDDLPPPEEDVSPPPLEGYTPPPLPGQGTKRGGDS